MLNFNPSAFGNDVLLGLVGVAEAEVVVVTAEVVVEVEVVDVVDVVVPLETGVSSPGCQ